MCVYEGCVCVCVCEGGGRWCTYPEMEAVPGLPFSLLSLFPALHSFQHTPRPTSPFPQCTVPSSLLQPITSSRKPLGIGKVAPSVFQSPLKAVATNRAGG